MAIPANIEKEAEEVNQFINRDKQNEESTQPETVEQVEVVEAPAEDWEKRFKNYKASTDQKLHEYRQRQTDIEQIQSQNESLKAEVKQLQQTKPESYSPEALELYGEDELKVIDNLVNQKTNHYEEKISSLEKFIEEQQRRDQITQTSNKLQTVVDRVAQAVPDFDKINNDPAFIAWMNEPDDFGVVRADAMNLARDNNNPSGITIYFDQWKAKNKQPIDRREYQQMPNGSPSKVGESQKFFSAGEVDQFYKDKMNGKYGDSEARAIEEKIFAQMRPR